MKADVMTASGAAAKMRRTDARDGRPSAQQPDHVTNPSLAWSREVPINPLSYLTGTDLQVLSAVAGRPLVAGSPIMPLLAAQIGMDRRSSALPMTEELSIGYFRAVTSCYREVGALSVGLLREIDLAMAFVDAERSDAGSAWHRPALTHRPRRVPRIS